MEADWYEGLLITCHFEKDKHEHPDDLASSSISDYTM